MQIEWLFQMKMVILIDGDKALAIICKYQGSGSKSLPVSC